MTIDSQPPAPTPADAPLPRREVLDVVRGYIIDRVRVLAEGHDALFERALHLYCLVETELFGNPGVRSRLGDLRTHALPRTLLKLLPARARQVIGAGVIAMDDNRQVIAKLEQRVAAGGATSRAAVEALYREVLVEVVPVERSLDNITSIADSSEVMHDFLTSSGLVARTMRGKGYRFLRMTVVRDEQIRTELDGLWAALADNPAELLALAENVREHGPAVVRAIYGP